MGDGSTFAKEVAQHFAAFTDAMNDDFNTGGAIGVVFELLTSLNRFADSMKLELPGADAKAEAEFRRGVLVLRQVSEILGLFWEPSAPSGGGANVNGLMQLLVDLRADARKTKNFAVADQIRDRLGKLGITLEDRAGGTGWRLG
jgi:cysteinyl-tRNA synthetase